MLTLATSVSQSFFTAYLIWCLLALTSTVNTSVLLSSVFFMADSVVRGNLMVAQWSSFFLLEVLFRGYVCCLLSRSVLGRRKVGDVRIFFFLWLCMPFNTAFLAFKAFALAYALGGAGASFFTFGAIFVKKARLGNF